MTHGKKRPLKNFWSFILASNIQEVTTPEGMKEFTKVPFSLSQCAF